MSTAPIITDLQKINPSAVIELFTLTIGTMHDPLLVKNSSLNQSKSSTFRTQY